MDSTTGFIDILNCGAGHIEVKFDQADAEETAKAKKMIQDMLKRGYALFIHGEGDELIRVRKFDPAQNVYIVKEPTTKKEKKVPMHKARVTAVGRSAGG